MLNIKPLLQYFDGELGSTELCRGRKKSLFKVAEMFIEYLEKRNIDLEEYLLVTGEGLDVPEYKTFNDYLRENMREKGYPVKEWPQVQIGATIGVHTGPFPIGVGILKKAEI